ncbi:MAG: rod shape-determining protein MreC [Saprospiraceae bacterium]|jgi:rod shape-determining protein MreC
MNRIVKVFSEHYVLILFIFLQVVSLSVIFQGKNYHRSVFIDSLNNITGGTYSLISDYQHFLRLKEDNLSLAMENADLRAVLPFSVQKVNQEYVLVSDSLYRQKYLYRNAQVIDNSINKKNNYLILNLGANDGMMEEMGVVTSNGVVGMIVEVANHYSKAISFLNSNTRVSCKIQRNDAAGILYWNGLDSKSAILEDLPLTTEVLVGDTIMTSGYSSIYPKGILVGVVKEVADNLEKQMLDISISLTLDYNTLNHVYVIDNLDKDELENLKSQGIDD